MCKARANLRQFLNEFRRNGANALHITTVLRVENAPRDSIAGFPAVSDHLRTSPQHVRGDLEFLDEQRGRAFLARQLEAGLPAGYRHFPRNLFGKFDRVGRTVTHTEQAQCGSQTEKTHTVAPLALDL